MGRTSDAEERILRAAIGLFHQRGYSAVGISDVCADAEVNKGSFYHFYKSKQALALAVIDAYAERAQEVFAGAIAGEDEPIAQLRAIFDANANMHKMAKAHDGCVSGCLFGNLALELSTQDETVRKHLERHLSTQAATLKEVLTDAKRQGLIADVDPASAAEQLIALLQGAVLLAKVQNRPDALSDLTASALRLVGANPFSSSRT